MYEGDRSRKTVLVEHGFRLPSALDNRPLNFLEFQSMQNQTIYVSATPADANSNGRGRVLARRPPARLVPASYLKAPGRRLALRPASSNSSCARPD